MSGQSNEELRIKGNEMVQGGIEDEQTITVRRRHLPVREGMSMAQDLQPKYINDNPENLLTRDRMALAHPDRHLSVKRKTE